MMGAWFRRLAYLLRRSRHDAELRDEIEAHLALRAEHLERGGLTPEEAAEASRRALGNITLARDDARDVWLGSSDTWWQDARFAIRMLRKAPAFTATAIFVLAFGIGANGAVFSLVNAVLFKPLNGGRAHAELVGLYSGDQVRPDAFRAFSYPEFVDVRARNDVFDELFAEAIARVGLTEGGVTRRLSASYVSSNYFEALGASAALGRFFTAGEERPGSAAAVAVVSHGYWRRHGLRADIVGRPIVVSARPLTIVGVAPEGFRGTMPMMSGEFWLPLGAASLTAVDDGFDRHPISDDRSSFSLMLSGTLAPGLSAAEAQARLAPLAAALEAAYPQSNANQRLVVQRRSRVNFGLPPPSDAEPMIGATVLMIVAGMVLVVACLNLANLQLARGSVRRQEIAVRLAMGGSRQRIVRQLLVEGVFLSIAAGAIGTAVSWWVADRITSSMFSLLQTTAVVDVAPDGRVLALIGLACVVSTVVFALGPALKLSRTDLVTAMKQAGPLPSGRRRAITVPGALVGTQVALSLALLAAAGVFVRATLNTASSDPGFALENGVLVDIDTGIARMGEAESRTASARVLERLRGLPDVRAVSMASLVPFGNVRDGRLVRQNDMAASATFTVIGSDYFQMLGLPIVAGREFSPVEEGRETEPVAIVDEVLAARLFPGRSPLGELVQLARGDALDGAPLRIVGLVPTVRDDMLGTASAHVYVPYGRHFRGAMTFHVRTAPGREAIVLPRVRETIASVDSRLPVLSVRPMTALRDGSPDRWMVMLIATLFAAFGLTGVALSAAGLYGLRAYLVAQRTRELGIRIALGATRAGVVSQLLKEGATTALCGVVAGLGLAIGLVQVLRQSGMLYQVGLLDPVVLTVAPLILVGVTLAASYIPARRALRIDPAAALRPE